MDITTMPILLRTKAKRLRQAMIRLLKISILTNISMAETVMNNDNTADEAQNYASATREQALAIAVCMVENLK